jgi:adenylosuccinate synthase
MYPRKRERKNEEKHEHTKIQETLGGGCGGVNRRNTERSSVRMDVIQAQILRENLQNVIY